MGTGKVLSFSKVSHRSLDKLNDKETSASLRMKDNMSFCTSKGGNSPYYGLQTCALHWRLLNISEVLYLQKKWMLLDLDGFLVVAVPVFVWEDFLRMAKSTNRLICFKIRRGFPLSSDYQ